MHSKKDHFYRSAQGTAPTDHGLLTLRQIATRLNTNEDALRRRSHRVTNHELLKRKGNRINFPTPTGWDDSLNARLWRWADVREWAIAAGYWDGLVDAPTRRQSAAADRIVLDVITLPVDDWQTDGLCKERPEVDFFNYRQRSTAKKTCADCLVRFECLLFAVADPDAQGVWGGYLFPSERKAALEVSR